MSQITDDTLRRDAESTAYRDMARMLRDQFGMSERVAMLLLAEVQAWSGSGYKSSLVVPSTDARQVQAEDVVAAFNGRNRDEVIRRFRISRRTFYRYISQR